MCLQTFLHFSCSHDITLLDYCDSGARMVDLVPFYIPLACPDYQITRIESPYACGARQYYNGDDIDGRYLTRVLRQQQLVNDKITQIDMKLTYIQHGSTALSQQLHNAGFSDAGIKQNPQYLHQVAGYKFAWQAKEGLLKTRSASGAILEKAKTCHPERVLTETGLLSIAVAESDRVVDRLTSRVSHSQVECETHSPAPHTPGYAPSLASSPRKSSGHTGQFLGSVQQSGGARLHHVLKDELERKADEIRKGPSAKLKRQRTRGKTFQHRNESDSERSEPIRRSARVRNKKINYAETTSSSRSMSPAKSDYSNFSPSRSAVNVAAEMRRPGAHAPSASIDINKVNDWKAREFSFGFPGHATSISPRETRQSSIESNIVLTPAKPVQRPNSPSNFSSPFDQPNVRPFAPVMERNDSHAALTETDQRFKTKLYGSGDLWARTIGQQQQNPAGVDDPSFTKTAQYAIIQARGAAMSKSSPFMHDSLLLAPSPQQFPSEPTTRPEYHRNARQDSALHDVAHTKDRGDPDYESLQRSFGSMPDLFPHGSTAVPRHAPTNPIDPTKRTLTSPDPRLSKRPRLSFPGEDTNYRDTAVQPPQLESPFSQRLEPQYPLQDRTYNLTSVPAPNFPHAGVAYMANDPTQQQQQQQQSYVLPQHLPYTAQHLTQDMAQQGQDDILMPSAQNVWDFADSRDLMDAARL